VKNVIKQKAEHGIVLKQVSKGRLKGGRERLWGELAQRLRNGLVLQNQEKSWGQKSNNHDWFIGGSFIREAKRKNGQRKISRKLGGN